MRTVLVVAHERHIGRLIEVNLQREGYSVARLNVDEATPFRMDRENPALLFLPSEWLPSSLWTRHSKIALREGGFQLWRRLDEQDSEVNLEFL